MEKSFEAWKELIPEALEQIFRGLSVQEKLVVIPSVCKSWGRMVNVPYCWEEIEIEGWKYYSKPQTFNLLLQLILRRSSGKLCSLSITALANDPNFLSLIADYSQSLKTLKLPRSWISDSTMLGVAARFSTVTYLDVSHCGNISADGLKAIGKNCRNLTRLDRTLEEFLSHSRHLDEEASAIAATMPKLKHLEIGYMHISNNGLLKILSGCPDLELLDIRGCQQVKLDQTFVKKISYLKVFGP
ncbi:F-box protein FBW2-like [Humulus lupulus]|uniref:F-box protein FBW2-like n=1 Tax=Humulus lupulus TaxID=3486 RepID=UPI002B406E59|nr:F-box protein FBW2-like [Humulus lupulus]